MLSDSERQSCQTAVIKRWIDLTVVLFESDGGDVCKEMSGLIFECGSTYSSVFSRSSRNAVAPAS
jgi:hypothetical protein